MSGRGLRTCTFQQLIDDGLLEIGDGYRAKNEELGGTGPLFLRAGHVTDSHIDFDGVERFHASLADKVKMKMARVGDTIMTTKGNSTGRTSFVTAAMPEFVYSPHLSYWRTLDANQLASGFLRYWSRSLEFTQQLSGMKASTDMAPYLSLTDQRRLKITLLPGADQRAIACILGALDDKIELNRRRNGTLEAMARAIFQAWFVDFEPVRAKAAGRRPPGLNPELAALFPNAFQDSELGEIPKGWRVGTLEKLAFLNSESWTKATRPTTINYVDLSNAKWGRIETVVTHAEDDAPSRAQRVLRPGDSIIGMVRPGNGSYAFVLEEGLTGSTGFAVLRPRRAEYAEFIYLAATDRKNIERLSHLADGAAYPAVRPEVVAATRIVQPGDEVLRSFSRTVTVLMKKKMAQAERESHMLAALRDALLPKLISGELRVPDAERIIRRTTR